MQPIADLQVLHSLVLESAHEGKLVSAPQTNTLQQPHTRVIAAQREGTQREGDIP